MGQSLVTLFNALPPELAFRILDDLPTQYLDIFRQQNIQIELIDWMIEERFLGYKKSPTMMTPVDYKNAQTRQSHHSFEYQPRVSTPAKIYHDAWRPDIDDDRYVCRYENPAWAIHFKDIHPDYPNIHGIIPNITQDIIDEFDEQLKQYAEREYGMTRFDLIKGDDEAAQRDRFYYNTTRLPRHSYFELDLKLKDSYRASESPHEAVEMQSYEQMLAANYPKEYNVWDYQIGVFKSEVYSGKCRIIADSVTNPISDLIVADSTIKSFPICTEITGKTGQAQSIQYKEHFPVRLFMTDEDTAQLTNEQKWDLNYITQAYGLTDETCDGFVLNRPSNIRKRLIQGCIPIDIAQFGDRFVGWWWQRSHLMEYSKPELEEASRAYHKYFDDDTVEIINNIWV